MRIFDKQQAALNYKLNTFVKLVPFFSKTELLHSAKIQILAATAVFICIFAFKANAQTTPGTTSFMYEKETSVGFLAHTKGLGASVQFTKHRNASSFRLLDFNFYSLKHPKEIKLPNPDLTQSRPYVFGKLNQVYILKANYGRRRILADKWVHDGVRINLNYSIGPTLAFLKPIYYDIRTLSPDNRNVTVIQEKFSEENISWQQNTLGEATFFKGFSETGFMPGANAKTSMSFEWGPTDNKFYSLEAGVMVDAFPKDVPIFAYIKNDQVFVNLFFALSYGSRR